MRAPTIATSRLTLRAHRRDDFEALHALWCEPGTYRFITGKPSDREQSWARLARYHGFWPLLGYGFWALEHRATGAYIGEAGFADLHRDLDPPFGDRPEAGWMLDPDYWHQGLASEALTAVLAWLDAHHSKPAVCMITQGNEASLKLAGRFGFQRYIDATYHGDAVTLLQRPFPIGSSVISPDKLGERGQR